jgi:hypothetical protein
MMAPVVPGVISTGAVAPLLMAIAMTPLRVAVTPVVLAMAPLGMTLMPPIEVADLRTMPRLVPGRPG